MINSREGDKEFLASILSSRNTKVMIVSDGLFHLDFRIGATAWVITTLISLYKPVYGDNITPKKKRIQCSHRSELSGITGVLIHLY